MIDRDTAIAQVRALIDRRIREGYAYQWWIDLDGPRLFEIVDTVLDSDLPEPGQ